VPAPFFWGGVSCQSFVTKNRSNHVICSANDNAVTKGMLNIRTEPGQGVSNSKPKSLQWI